MNIANLEPFGYEEAGEKLAECIPELRDAYQRELQWWGSERPAPHALYDEILNPYINELLALGGAAQQTALKRVFGFVEHLATAADARLRDLVGVTICEPLLADHVRLGLVRQYMGPATLGILKTVQQG
jgi:hypothetical protein